MMRDNPLSDARCVACTPDGTGLPVPTVTVPAIEAAIYVAPFCATNTDDAKIQGWPERGSHDHPGNAEILVDGVPVHWMKRIRPWFASRNSWQASIDLGLSDEQRAQFRGFYSAWIEGGMQNRPEIEANRRDAIEMGLRHIVYSDTDDYPQDALNWLDPRFESPMVRAYPAREHAGETAEERRSRVMRNVEMAIRRGFKVSIALPFYTQSGNWTLANVLGGLDRTLDVLRYLQFGILMLAPFAYARKSGMREHPPLLELFERLCVAIPGREPADPDYSPPAGQVGELTIASFGPIAGPAPLRVRAVARVIGGPIEYLEWLWRRAGDTNWQAALFDGHPVQNPVEDLDHTYRDFREPGTYEIKLRGLDAQRRLVPGAETGLRRVVEVH